MSTPSDDGMDSQSPPPEHYENDYSPDGRNPQHNSRRLWYIVAGGVTLVALIAVIAGGSVAASNNKSASNGASGSSGTVNIPLPEDDVSTKSPT